MEKWLKMKIKNLMIISLILTIMTIGAVCASDNMADDNLATGDMTQETIEETQDDEISSSDANEDTLADFDENNFYISEEIQVNDSSPIVEIFGDYSGNINGSLKVSIGDKDYYDKNITIERNSVFLLYLNETSNLPMGNVILKVQFTPEGKSPIIVEKETIIYDFKVFYEEYEEWDEFYDGLGVTLNNDLKIKLEFDKSFSDKIYYVFQGQTYNVDYSEGCAYFTVPSANLDLGKYSFEVKKGNQTRKMKFEIEPYFLIFPYIALDKDCYVSFIVPKYYSGTGYIYYYDEENETVGDLIKQENAVNGIVTILMPKLKNGTHSFMFSFNSTNYNFTDSFEITVGENDPNITVSVNPIEIEVGDVFTVEGKSNGCYYILAVNETFINFNYTSGSFNEVISGLDVGKYRIVVLTLNSAEDYYYNLFYVTVSRIATEIILTNETLELKYNEIASNLATLDPSEGNLTYVSSNETVVVIEGGSIIAVGVGNATVTVSFAGNGTHAAAESKSIKVTVIPLDEISGVNETEIVNKTSTEIKSSAVTTVYNVNKYLVVNLKDANGNPLKGVNLTVDLNGAKTYITDSNGQIKVSTKSLAPNQYTAKVTFNGDAKYLKSTLDVKVTVKKANSKLAAKNKTFKNSVKVKKYSIVLKDNLGKTIKNAKVTIKIGKKTFKAKTNAKGKATFKIKKLTKGKYKAKVTYKGNKYFNKKTKKVKITIK